MTRSIQEMFARYIELERQRDTIGLAGTEEDEWIELKRVLTRHFQPELEGNLADRRSSIRFPTRAELRYQSYADMGESVMTQVSRCGLFIPTRHPLPIGTRLSLNIETPDGTELHLVGEVVSHDERPDPDQSCSGSGMGVRFERLSEDQRKAIDEFYEASGQRAVGLRS